jgi:hypothetical protein
MSNLGYRHVCHVSRLYVDFLTFDLLLLLVMTRSLPPLGNDYTRGRSPPFNIKVLYQKNRSWMEPTPAFRTLLTATSSSLCLISF